MNETKYRHELKFILSSSQAIILKHRLAFIMEYDEMAVNKDHSYHIRSLYFDDIENSAYYDKIEGISERDKYRIRLYNSDDSFIVLEKKSKNRDLVNKTQAKVTKSECLNLVQGYGNLDYNKMNEPLKEMIKKMEEKHLVPSVIVEYKRLAYTYAIEDVRVTFDEKVTSGRFDYNLFSKDVQMYDILENNQTILEVKFNKNIPSHIASIIMSIPSLRLAASKYTYCFEKKEM